jgi:hypothetical protein
MKEARPLLDAEKYFDTESSLVAYPSTELKLHHGTKPLFLVALTEGPIHEIQLVFLLQSSPFVNSAVCCGLEYLWLKLSLTVSATPLSAFTPCLMLFLPTSAVYHTTEPPREPRTTLQAASRGLSPQALTLLHCGAFIISWRFPLLRRSKINMKASNGASQHLHYPGTLEAGVRPPCTKCPLLNACRHESVPPSAPRSVLPRLYPTTNH